MSAGNVITGKLGCIAKIDISTTKTAYSDQVSCTLVLDPQIIEIISSSANSAWVGRDIEAMDWSATIRVAHPAAEDAAIAETRAAAIGGLTDEFSFTIPHSTPTVFTGTAIVRQTISAETGSYLFDEYELTGASALVET